MDQTTDATEPLVSWQLVPEGAFSGISAEAVPLVLPWRLDAEEAQRAEAGDREVLTDDRLVEGVLLAWGRWGHSPSGVPPVRPARFLRDLLEHLRQRLGWLTLEGMVAQISCEARQAWGATAAARMLEAGVDLEPGSSLLKVKLILDLWQLALHEQGEDADPRMERIAALGRGLDFEPLRAVAVDAAEEAALAFICAAGHLAGVDAARDPSVARARRVLDRPDRVLMAVNALEDAPLPVDLLRGCLAPRAGRQFGFVGLTTGEAADGAGAERRAMLVERYMGMRSVLEWWRVPLIRLENGGEVRVHELFQSRTYEGLYEGMPYRSLNRRLVERARGDAEGKLSGTAPVVLLEPPERPIEVPERLAGRAGVEPDDRWCDIPHVRCLASLTRYPAREEHRPPLCLKLVWFQGSFAPPIDPSVVGRMQRLDWDALATEVEY